MSEIDDSIGAIQSGFDESETQFRLAIEQSPLAIEILTPHGKIEKVNSAWKDLWNLNEEDATEILKNYNMLSDTQLVELGIMPLVEKVFSGEYVILPEIEYSGDRVTKEMGLRHISSQTVWIQCHLYPIKDSSGELTRVVNIYVDITNQKRVEEEQKNILDRLENETLYLKGEIKLEHNFENIIGNSEPIQYVLSRISQVAPTESPVLIMGETGTGKELVARAIHNNSSRKNNTLVKINCAALPKDLVESELFGHEKGAFTGAHKSQIGRFELASESTLFLDEVGELSLEIQAKLLRVLESGEYERIGSSSTRTSYARIITATNKVLENEVKAGRFREDLWYRLKVFPITVPPLRDRPEDIELILNYYLKEESRKLGKAVSKISKNSLEKLLNYTWPGNVRELKHVIEVAVITSRDKLIFDLPRISEIETNKFKTLEEVERECIIQVLESKNWKIGGENSASSVLGLHVNTLRGKMKKLGISKR